MNIRNFLVAVIILFTFGGCGAPVKDAPLSKAARSDAAVKEQPRRAPGAERVKAQGEGAHKKRLLRKTLYTQFDEWKGVRYRLGGLNKKGVDCSGFVYLTFKSKLGVRLPRTTDRQSRLGRPVDKENLKTGDLVFFKTGLSVRHVGIYLEDGKFMHASKKRGVMISKLDNVYWRSKYWKARRVKL